MHINDIDLNLLRLFDAVYRTRSVSRAAELLGLTQPAASQGLTRLRTLISDPLFMRSGGGVQPTPKAQRLADPVRQALATLEQALGETAGFDPARSTRSFQIHMSDIGESRFLPELMVALRERAPGVRVETRPVPREQVNAALDAGRIDFAFGFLPMVRETQRLELLRDRYVVLLRAGHPFTRKRRTGKALLEALKELEFVGVRSHADTLRIVQELQLEGRLRLVTEHFLVLPAIVHATDLAAVMPLNIARGFEGGYAIVEPDFPQREFVVALHWSKRFEGDPGNRWLRSLIEELFRA
ncbi:MAG: LysR family transcriptional regulator [Ramlibacter sp.]